MYLRLSLIPRLSPLRRGRAGRAWEQGYPSLIPRLRGRRQTFLFSHAAWVRGYMYPRLATDQLLPCSLIYTMSPICLAMHYLFLNNFQKVPGKRGSHLFNSPAVLWASGTQCSTFSPASSKGLALFLCGEQRWRHRQWQPWTALKGGQSHCISFGNEWCSIMGDAT